ncbi:HIT family protein [Thauera humireducens]|uniref:HIT family protein n=1 Tax=Thauera humireducens TaxID=1134435 RepID=UPI002467AB19|nr:HIT family protein [Thauera humireducens]CAH1749484.1 HIT family protein [Thauera humireducens]
MSKASCTFCALPAERILLLVDEAMAIRDAFPVSQGYTLVFPCRHVGSFFKLTESERACVLQLLAQAKADLDLSFYPNGFNIGIDDGDAVRLTFQHLHLQLIPRYRGDASDPRGGVRWVLPAKAKYWTE